MRRSAPGPTLLCQFTQRFASVTTQVINIESSSQAQQYTAVMKAYGALIEATPLGARLRRQPRLALQERGANADIKIASMLLDGN